MLKQCKVRLSQRGKTKLVRTSELAWHDHFTEAIKISFSNLDCTERAKELPKNILFSFRSEIVHKDAPAAAVHGGQRGSRCSGLQEGISG